VGDKLPPSGVGSHFSASPLLLGEPKKSSLQGRLVNPIGGEKPSGAAGFLSNVDTDYLQQQYLS